MKAFAISDCGEHRALNSNQCQNRTDGNGVSAPNTNLVTKRSWEGGKRRTPALTKQDPERTPAVKGPQESNNAAP
jgi:hypothetical protein